MGSVYSEIFTNTYDTIVSTRKCTQPNENLKKIIPKYYSCSNSPFTYISTFSLTIAAETLTNPENGTINYTPYIET